MDSQDTRTTRTVAPRGVTTRASHKYRGQVIYRCERAPGEHRGRWIVQTYHAATGLPWADQVCPHYQTLADAKDSIDIEAMHAAREQA